MVKEHTVNVILSLPESLFNYIRLNGSKIVDQKKF